MICWATTSRLLLTASVAKDADFVIEVILENMELKKDLLRELGSRDLSEHIPSLLPTPLLFRLPR